MLSKDLKKLQKYSKNNSKLYMPILGHNDSRNSACYMAAYHRTTYTNHPGTVIFVVQGVISRLNKNPSVYSGVSKHPGYRYNMLKRRRKLLKEGYRFDPETREWVKR